LALAPNRIPYLRPTMSSVGTSARDGCWSTRRRRSRHATPLAYASLSGEHMGSRSVVPPCRHEKATRGMGATREETGAVYTYAGRSFLATTSPREILHACESRTEAVTRAASTERTRPCTIRPHCGGTDFFSGREAITGPSASDARTRTEADRRLNENEGPQSLS